MIILTGTYPPEKCGVGDYSYQLLHTTVAKENKWQVYHARKNSIGKFFATIKEINAMGDDSINLQYPSMGFLNSLMPHLFCLYFRIFSKKKISVTVHEYTQLGWKGKFCTYIFLIFAHKLIFTNEFERHAAIRSWYKTAPKSTVIKIYSNIIAQDNLKKIENRQYDIGYFGYIRPEKGLEDYITVIANMKKKNTQLKTYILGQTQPVYKQYYEDVLKQATAVGIDIILNKDDEFVSNVLAETKIAYLPFPDGVSERRGSFLACVKNKMLVVTTEGLFTTNAHRNLLDIATKDNAENVIQRLLSLSTYEWAEKQQQIEKFIDSEMPASWDEVAQQYHTYLL